MHKIRTDISETFDTKRAYFYECDYKNRLKISEFLKLSSEVAGHDYTQKGLTHEFLWENNMVFLVSRMSFHIYEYPENQVPIVSSTWEKGKKGAMFLRGFAIKSPDGKLYAEGTAGWILVNPDTRKIIKPALFQYPMPQIMDRETKAVDIGRISCEDAELIGSRHVRISDLDGNGHVYNANYADMATDAFSQHIYEKDVENFRINFVSEAKFGDIISLWGKVDDKKAIIIGKIEDKTCFETEFIFK